MQRVNELGSEGMWEAEFLVKPVLFPSVVTRRQGNQSLASLLLRQTALLPAGRVVWCMWKGLELKVSSFR